MGTRHRGLLHPQWLAFFGITLLAAIVAMARASTHRTAAILAGGLLAQLLAWLFLTHIQSRFLLPLAAPACALVALATARAGRCAASCRYPTGARPCHPRLPDPAYGEHHRVRRAA